jgi:hypothetical protein
MNTPRPRSSSRLLLVLAAVAVTLFGLIAPASAAAPYCGITWGSLLKEGSGPSGGQDRPTLTGVRAGHHGCFDRVVVDVAVDPGAGYRVQYGAVFTEGKGDRVPLRGAADLRVILFADAPALSNSTELVHTTGPTVRQVAAAGSFEGQTTLGVGVRARLPFRVFTLAGPGSGGRVVIDVAHHW